MAKLIINPTSGAKKEIPITGKVISIGRDPSNDLVLSDSMVSRRHAILELQGEHYVLRDNNSSNGTLVNGDKISSEHPVRDGDLISIGSCRLLFQLDSATSAAGPPTAVVPQAAAPGAPAAPAPAGAPAPGPAPAGSGIACEGCGLPATAADRFCRQCGRELPSARRTVCPTCGSPVKPPANFCGTCGKPLPREGGPRLPPTQPLVRDKSLDEGTSPRPSPPPAAPVAHGIGGEGELAEGAARPHRDGRRGPEPLPVSAGPAGRKAGNGGVQALASPAPPEVARVGAAAAPRPVGAARPVLRMPARPATEAAAAAVGAAGFGIRLAAYLIDGLILSIPTLAIVGITIFLIFRRGPEIDPSAPLPGVVILPLVLGNLLTVALAFFYLLYFWGARGATPGKKLLGLKVVTASGESPIGYGRAALRILGYFLNVFTFGIGFLLIAFNEEKRGLHDRIADTRVVRDG